MKSRKLRVSPVSNFYSWIQIKSLSIRLEHMVKKEWQHLTYRVQLCLAYLSEESTYFDKEGNIHYEKVIHLINYWYLCTLQSLDISQVIQFQLYSNTFLVSKTLLKFSQLYSTNQEVNRITTE